jgi:D-cysteine desulfhydrase family pyridoxal phosphate-dependent enzyme
LRHRRPGFFICQSGNGYKGRGDCIVNLDRLSKIKLIPAPTPFEKAERLTKALGGPAIWLKRDDLTGIGLGGNKVRKLEYLLSDALNKNCNVAVTTAAMHSNFLRVFTAACNRCGIKPVVFMRGKEEIPEGNYLCTALSGAEMHYVDTDDPYSDTTVELMNAAARDAAARGDRAYLIHLGTFSGALAAVGYVDGAHELFSQAGNMKVKAIYAAAGSGGTHAGLLAGCRLLGKNTRIEGISVNVNAETLTENVCAMANGAIRLMGEHFEIPLANVHITDKFVQPGYGKVSGQSAEAIDIMVQSEGILLDPVYTGKALAALICDIRAGRWAKDDNIVFLHTGGAPNLFAHGHELLKRKGELS